MQVICWGTRGSIPTPLTPQETARKVQAAARRGPGDAADPVSGRASWSTYGGDTSCVEIRASDELTLVIDLGTGFRQLSHRLAADTRANRLVVFLSHLHMDHLIGLPLATVAYRQDTEFDVYGRHRHDVALDRFMHQVQAPPYFPVPLDQMGARFTFHEFEACGEAVWRSPAGLPRVAVSACPVDHPNGCVSFRVETDSGALVYASDRETPGRADEAFQTFAHGATHLLHDAQYTPAQYAGEEGPSRQSWGHSTYQSAVDAALQADVRHLVLWHHDPEHTDDQLDAIGGLAAEHMDRLAHERGRPPIPVSMAYDGLTLDL